jgi:cytidine deaminase
MNDSRTDRAMHLAAEARDRSYSPYTDFPMGAALIGPEGEEVVGALVENVSLGLAMCAERVALFTAVVAGVHPEILAVCSRRTDDRLTFPCGACLQVALEIAGPELVVVAVDPDGQHEASRLVDLLPRGPHRPPPS